MFDDNDSWLAGIGVDVQGIIGSVQQKATAVVEQAKGAVSAAATATGVAPAAKPAAAPTAKPAAPKPAAPTGAPSTNGSSAFALKGSVGAGGSNNPDDVKIVQTALKIDADGKCGSGTIAAIKAFQKSIGQANPDGRVDVGGATSKALAGRGGGAAAPAPAPAPNAALTPTPAPKEEGFFDGLKKKVVGKLEEAAGAAKDFPSNVLKGAEDLAGGAKNFVPSALGDVSGGNPAVASNLGIKVPKLSLDNLTKEQIDAANAFLATHVTAEQDPSETPKDPSGFLIKLKGKIVTVDEVVQALKAEIPSRVLQNPTAELKELVARHIKLSALDASRQRTSGKPGAKDVFAPPRLIAKAGPGRVQLLWKGVKGAKSYNVYRSEISGDVLRGPRIVNTTTFTDTGVTNDITYFYHVTANIANGGESASSPEASAKPQAAGGTSAQTQIDPKKGVVKTKVKWGVDFTADGARSPIHSAEIETQVDEAGNADSVEAQLNIIEANIQRKLTTSGKVTITASVTLAVKGALGPDVFESAKAEVKGEVELKLNKIILKAAASVSPDGKVEPSFAIVLWKF